MKFKRFFLSLLVAAVVLGFGFAVKGVDWKSLSLSQKVEYNKQSDVMLRAEIASLRDQLNAHIDKGKPAVYVISGPGSEDNMRVAKGTKQEYHLSFTQRSWNKNWTIAKVYVKSMSSGEMYSLGERGINQDYGNKDKFDYPAGRYVIMIVPREYPDMAITESKIFTIY